MGHIELSMMTFNPIFIQIVLSVLRMTCFNCFRMQISDNALEILTLQLQLIDTGYIIEAQEIEIFKSESVMSKSNEEEVVLAKYYELVKSGKWMLSIALKKLRIVCKKKKSFSGIKDGSMETTKNIEALRNSIVSSAIRNSANKICLHCKEAMRRVKYSFKRLVIPVFKTEMDSTL